ncbi:MAG TPA: DUF5808 domain-containing protein [Terriglobales bacterium]
MIMRLILCTVYIFIGALVFASPNMSRRELLFAVPVPPDFRQSRAGQHAIRMFRLVIVMVVAAAAGAMLLSPASFLSMTAAVAPIAIVLAGVITFRWQNHALAVAAIQFTGSREVEMSVAPDDLPRFAWLAGGPFVVLAAAATWLYLHWDRIPARFPVHFGADGQANRWAERTIKGVYGPLFFGTEICSWVLIMALAGWFGSRRSRSRPVMLGGVIAIEYILGLLFALIAVQPLTAIPIWAIVLSPMVILILLIIVMTRKMSEPWEPMDPTPNECWKADVFYYNPNDGALFVEKRDGLGYTFNFANRWSWALLLGLVLVIASVPFVLA